jgi:O-antigen ligase/polysaccharide polymerase Wzy-like membrane protein
VTHDPSLGLPAPSDARRNARSAESPLVVRMFAIALGGLLVGYMFLGRGFAHVGIGPVYVGDLILFLGVATATFVAVRAHFRAPVTWTIALLIAFAALGAVRTIPYLGTYGVDALRDGVLWGYAAFALIVYLIADRQLVLSAFRTYGWVVPIFAVWLPICWNIFAAQSQDIDPSRLGSDVPLVFFKGGDMAVHTVGAIAFLVLGASAVWSTRTFVWRLLICLPLLWTVFVAGTSNRGALVTVAVGIVAVVMLAPRSRNWLPLLGATAVFVMVVIFQGLVSGSGGSAANRSAAPTPAPSGSPTSPPSVQLASAPTRHSVAGLTRRLPYAAAGASSTPEPQGGVRLAVPNAGFELGPLNNGTIEGWTPRGAGSHNIVAGPAYRGARFASVQNAGGAYEDTLTSSRFAFSGKDIAVSVWVKAITSQPTLEIYVNWYDESGTLISSIFLDSLATHGVRTWQECAGALPAPPNATDAELKLFEAAGKATMGLDEVVVRSGDFITEPVLPERRPATIQQMIENFLSIFGSSSDGGLEGSKQFRLAWWGKIVSYTVFGDYFWTGKGFGVNLADDDGFQSTTDRSLRAPHNTHMTVLARMGVPGLLLWLLVQGAFGIGLLRATLASRRARDALVAAVGAWILVYWVAMMVDTSFDPYLEGPQGGIWFWVIFGLGLVVMNLVPRRRVAT